MNDEVKKSVFMPTGLAKAIGNRIKSVLYGSPVVGIRRAPESDWSMAVPFDFEVDLATETLPKIAIICHLFHAELAQQIFQELQYIFFDSDVFISTDTVAKRDTIEKVFAAWSKGQVCVRVTPNRGRDIAPKLIAYRDVYDRYELVLHLHSKRQKREVLDGAVWRKVLMTNLVGSSAVSRSIIAAFCLQPSLGIIISQHWEPIRPWVHWSTEFASARQLAHRMSFDISPDKIVDFPSGSMFWARSAALRPLLDLALSFEDFPPETGQTGSTLAHAIERLYLYACERAGFSWLKVADPTQFRYRKTILPISSIADFDRFQAAHAVQLLAGNDESASGIVRSRLRNAIGRS
jgi:lipopolysaccharide biosynthesis protein